MSKLFEALTRANGELANVALPVITAAGGVRTEIARLERASIVDSADAAEEMISVLSAVPETEVRVQALNVRAGAPLIVDKSGSSAASEQYRIIRTRILQHDRRTKVLLVSSATPGDGKTVSAINIASVLALRDCNVLLIDTDLRRATFARTLGIPNAPGLGDVLSGQAELQTAVMRTEQNPNLYVLTAGNHTENPAELLDSPRWKTLCSTVRERFDFIVMDAPPIAAVADYELLQAACDSVIIVVRPDHTDKSMCMRAIALVPEEKLLGVVVNCAYEWFLSKTHHSYGYYGAKAPV